MSELTPEQQAKQIAYRNARFTKQYDGIWQSTGKCVFCDLRDKYVVLEENGIALTISLYAYIDGHLMIIPRRHVSAAKDLTQVEWETVRKFTYVAKKMIKDVHGIKGVQFLLREGGIVAQSTVSDHLHIHAIPFDAPDLSVWNYRKLKLTPLESAATYRSAAKKIISYQERFDRKYHNQSRLGVVVDVIIVNKRSEVLFQERHPDAKIGPGYITIPGGSIEHDDPTLEAGLAREVREETGAVVDPSQFELVTSRLEKLRRHRRVEPIGGSYEFDDRFLWNTYVLRGFDSTTPLTAGDDAESLLWVPLADVPNHPRISNGIKAAIAKVRP